MFKGTLTWSVKYNKYIPIFHSILPHIDASFNFGLKTCMFYNIFYTLLTETFIFRKEINVTYKSIQSAIFFLIVFLSPLGTWPSLFSSMAASLICVSMSMSLLMIHLEFMFLKMDLSDLQLASKWFYSCIKLVYVLS